MVAKRRKPTAVLKSEGIRIRVNRAEKASWTRAAQLKGLDLSNWIRMLATTAAQQPNE
jgi:uncharacterized protein (DUF1778 family)